MTEPYKVTRNGITVTLSNFKIIRGENKDKEYPAVKLDAGSWESTWAPWLGLDYIIGVLQTALKRDFQSLYLDNKQDDGYFNDAKFLVEAAELQATSAKLSELKDRYDEMVAEQCGLVENFDPTNTELVKRISELGTSIKVVKSQMDQKSRKSKPEQPTEAAVAV